MADTANLQIKVTSTGVKKASDDLNNLSKNATRADKSSKQASSGLSRVGRSAGQAGIQVQQFVGQIQGGQSAMLALSQQGADLGFVLGAPLVGAIVGIGASLLGMATNAFTSETALDKLEKISKKLGRTMETSTSGVDVLSQKLLDLAEKSDALAQLEISKGIIQSEQQIRVSAEKIQEILNETTGVSRDFYDSLFGSQGVGQPGGQSLAAALVRRTVQSISEEYNVGKDIAEEYASAISLVKTDASAVNIRALENALTSMNEATGGSNIKLLELAESLSDYLEQNRKGVENVNFLRIAYADLEGAIKKTNEENEKINPKKLRDWLQTAQDGYKAIPDSIAKYQNALESVSTSLEYQTIALEQGAQAAFEYQVAQRLGLENAEQIPEQIQAQIDKVYALKEAQSELKTSQEELKLSAEEMYQSIAENAVQGLGDATASALVEMKSLGEGIKGVLRGALKQAISTLVQLGLQEVLFAKTKASAKSIETAAIVAQGAAISASMGPAAAVTTAATGGSNLVTAQGILPSFTAAFTAAMSAAGTVGRQSGGDLQGGQSSYIAENGIEIFTPNKAGRVFNSDEVAEMIRGGGNSSSAVINLSVQQENFDQWLDNGGLDKIQRKLRQAEFV